MAISDDLLSKFAQRSGIQPNRRAQDDLLDRFGERVRGRGRQITSIEELLEAWEEEDIDLLELLSNIPGSAVEFGGDVASALGEIVTSPVQTAKALGTLGVGVADLPFRAAGQEATGIQRRGREALGDVASGIAGSLTPQALTERPVEGLANLAVGGGTALKGLGALSRVGRMPQVAETLQKAGRTAMAADPTTMPLRAAAAGTRAAGRGIGRVAGAGRRKAREVGGTIDEAIGGETPTGRKVPLWKEVLAGGLAFTTGTSPGTILLALEKAREGMGSVIRTARNDRVGAWEDIVKRGVEATKTVRSQANDLYNRGKNQIQQTGVLDDLVSHQEILPGIEQTLARFGVRINAKPVDITGARPPQGSMPAGAYADVRPPVLGRKTEYEVKFDDNSAVSEIGANEGIIRKQVKDLLNNWAKGDAGTDVDAMRLEHILTRRKQIDDSISTLSPLDNVSASVRAILSDIRTQLRSKFDEKVQQKGLTTDYMGGYEDAKIALEEYRSMLGLGPEMVSSAGKFGDGMKLESINKMNRALNEGRENVLNRIRSLEDVSGDNTIMARMVGAAMQPLLGSGLVVKSEISQAFRAAAGLGAGLWNAPAVVLFSPRAVNELLLRVSGMAPGAAARGQVQALVQSVRAMQPKLKPLGIDLKDIAKEGMTIGVLIERLNEVANAEEQQTMRR
jgi:hypothetical protein